MDAAFLPHLIQKALDLRSGLTRENLLQFNHGAACFTLIAEVAE
ncbi:MAG: hypothetical protein ABIK28_02665 [Planctomycetota bacterium]